MQKIDNSQINKREEIFISIITQISITYFFLFEYLIQNEKYYKIKV